MSDEQPPLSPAIPEVDFDKVMTTLESLANTHEYLKRFNEMRFKLDVGKTVLLEFFGDDIATYRDRTSKKTSSLHRFVVERKESLSKLGLSEQTLRRCILGYDVAKGWPQDLLEKLSFSHLTELIPITDANTRLGLAQLAVANDWGARDMKGAAANVRAGKWPDGNPNAPGVRPAIIDAQPAPPEKPSRPGKKQQTGRVVSAFESTVKGMKKLTAHFDQEIPPKVTPLQKDRVLASLNDLKEKTAKLEAAIRRLP